MVTLLHMHITILHHSPIAHPHQSQSGASIRLQHLCSGLQTRLPTLAVSFLCKQEVEGNWKTHIHRHIHHTSPDIIFCAQMDDVALLPSRESLPNIPIVVDLYAPRLLENLFESDDGQVSHHILQAIARSDAYLIAHEDQRDHWQALLRVMGVDDIDKRTLVTPLGLEVLPNTRPKDLTLVGGGRVWPWQHPWKNLDSLLQVLEARQDGTVVWFAPPDQAVPISHPRLTIQTWTNRTAYRVILSQATMGVDMNPNTPERRLACAFRHMEYLGCGIPILSANDNILSRNHPKLCKHIDFSDHTNISTALNQTVPKSALKRFQETHHPNQIVSNFVQWLDNPTVQDTKKHWVLEALMPVQHEFDAQAMVTELESQVAALTQTHITQTALLKEANQQVQTSSASLLQVSKSLEQISAFKNDIAHNWSDLMHQQQERIHALEESLRQTEADNAKKSAELHAMDQLRARLENDLQHTREELAQQKKLSIWKR